jgi:hypothetical protein
MKIRMIWMLSGMGAAYGTAKSGVGVASMGVMRPELVMKSIVPGKIPPSRHKAAFQKPRFLNPCKIWSILMSF